MAQQLWTDLKIRAATYSLSCDVLIGSGNNELTQNSLEAAHLALELAMKAVIRKSGGRYPDSGPDGHNLESLVFCQWGTKRECISALIKALGATQLSNIALSCWTMDCRYKVLVDQANMKASIDDYKGFYEWIKVNLL